MIRQEDGRSSIPYNVIEDALRFSYDSRMLLTEKDEKLQQSQQQVLEWRRRAQNLAADLEMELAYRRQLEKRLSKTQASMLEPVASQAVSSFERTISGLQTDVRRLEELLEEKIQRLSRAEVELEEKNHLLIVRESDLDRAHKQAAQERGRLQERLQEQSRIVDETVKRNEQLQKELDRLNHRFDQRNLLLQTAMRWLDPSQLDELTRMMQRMQAENQSLPP
eukprot:ANDGO_05872.mRNA.1 hypothetical protein